MTKRDAAVYCGVSRQAVERAVAAGLIGVVKRGKRGSARVAAELSDDDVLAYRRRRHAMLARALDRLEAV